MPRVDLRRANLGELDLTAAPADLQRSFLTCASLTGADLGKADLAFADLSGADLSGADLSQVQNLTPRQLTGATVDAKTRLPEGVTAPGTPPWTKDDCIRYVKGMTGLVAGAGYDDKIACPRTTDAHQQQATELPQDQSHAAIVEVCSARSP